MFYCNEDENGKSFKWDTNGKKLQTVLDRIKNKNGEVLHMQEKLVEKKQKDKY